MNLSRKDVVQSMIERKPAPSVSIFMPVARTTPDARQNPVRLKNLIRESEAKLSQLGLNASEVERFMRPAHALNDDTAFWQQRSAGLAIYISADELHHHGLPYPTEEVVIVGSHWHIKPLLPFLMGTETFYLLALSKNHIRFWQATAYGLVEMELPGVPSSLKASLEGDHFERELQFHSAGPTRAGGRDAQFYGTGSTSFDEKELLKRYLLEVDRAVVAILHDDHAPLVVAGVDYVASMFRQLSEYNNVSPVSITGSPDEESAESLHAKALEIVAPIFEALRSPAEETLNELIGKQDKKASVDLNEILPAAKSGRVSVLFVALEPKIWGKTDESGIPIATDQGDQSTDDLLDLAALHTLANSGSVYARLADSMPGGVDIAAVMRY